MKKYVALRPVRFDRSYEVGEEIPAHVVAPGSEKRLIDQRRIAIVGTAEHGSYEAASAIESLAGFVGAVEIELGIVHEEGPIPFLDARMDICLEKLQLAAKSTEESNPTVVENVTEESALSSDAVCEPDNVGDMDFNTNKAEEEANVFRCPECDKVFTSQAGLSGHMRVHRR